MTLTELLGHAMGLEPAERVELAEVLLANTEPDDPASDAEWLEECESRLAAYKRGEESSIPWEELKAQVLEERAKYRQAQ